MGRMPHLLDRPPLIEAVLEIRFKSSRDSAGDLIPGMVYNALSDRFQTVQKLPVASIPSEMRASDENLRYLAHVRLSGHHESLMVGDRAAAYSKTAPYDGWSSFRDTYSQILNVLRGSGLITGIERFSFKCVNVLELAGRHPTELFNGELRLGGYELKPSGLLFRCEVDTAGFTSILEIAAIAVVKVEGTSKSGALLTVDTVKSVTDEEFWQDPLALVEAAHSTVKEIFFGVLKPSVIEEYGPIWNAPKERA